MRPTSAVEALEPNTDERILFAHIAVYPGMRRARSGGAARDCTVGVPHGLVCRPAEQKTVDREEGMPHVVCLALFYVSNALPAEVEV